MLWPLVKLFDAALFRKVREAFGGSLRFFVGGGALLEYIEFGDLPGVAAIRD